MDLFCLLWFLTHLIAWLSWAITTWLRGAALGKDADVFSMARCCSVPEWLHVVSRVSLPQCLLASEGIQKGWRAEAVSRSDSFTPDFFQAKEMSFIVRYGNALVGAALFFFFFTFFFSFFFFVIVSSHPLLPLTIEWPFPRISWLTSQLVFAVFLHLVKLYGNNCFFLAETLFSLFNSLFCWEGNFSNCYKQQWFWCLSIKN